MTHSRHWWWASAAFSKLTGSSFPTLPRKNPWGATSSRSDLAPSARVLGPLARTDKILKMEGIVIDTNVFVAAGFNPRSASACVLAAVRDGRFRLIWNQSTRRKIEMILRRIRRLDWEKVANLFQPEGEFTGPVDPSAFVLVRDRDDRKFAALSAAAKRPLVTDDNYLLADLSIIGIDALTPRAFLARAGEDT